jgi:transcription elongation factor Elf1
MAKEETYKMEAKCNNCSTCFEVDIPKGAIAKDTMRTCPYCGAEKHRKGLVTQSRLFDGYLIDI